MNIALDPRTDADLMRRAKRRVARKMGFLIHLTVFVLVNAGLWLLGSVQGGGARWNHWPLMGWGLGLAIHGIVTFLSLSGDGMRERMLDAELERLKKSGR